MFINKYVLIPILITCIYVVAMIVAGVPADAVVALIPILLIGHLLGYMFAMKHVNRSNNKPKNQ